MSGKINIPLHTQSCRKPVIFFTEVDDLDVMTAVQEESLQRFETDREILIERGNRDIAAGSEKRKADIPSLPAIEECRCVHQNHVCLKGGQYVMWRRHNCLGSLLKDPRYFISSSP